GDTLKQRLDEHLATVREIYDRVVHAPRPAPVAVPADRAPRGASQQEDVADLAAGGSNLTRVLDQRAPKLAQAIAAAGLRRGRVRFEHFLEEAMATPELLARLDADRKLTEGVLDLFEHSAYFADQLLRYPELLDEIGKPFQVEIGALGDAEALRRVYRRQMLRIQCASIIEAAPIFDTLAQTSVILA